MALFPLSPFAQPAGSFLTPVSEPTPTGVLTPIVITLDLAWLPLILGSLQQLTNPATWAGDQSAKLQAILDAYDPIGALMAYQLLSDVCPPLGGGGDCEDCMCCLRFENGVLQTLQCGVWVDVPGQPVGGFGGSGQPGTGQPQPQPGGGQSCYTANFNANGTWLLPTGVSTGDQIVVSALDGAGNDGTDANWWLLTGNQVFLGLDTGYNTTVGTDPLPASPHMSLILTINGTSYEIGNVGTFTVPGGVSGAQVTFQVNDQTLSDNVGSYSFQACVTNNSVGSFIHHFDFRAAQGPWKIGNRSDWATPYGNTSWIAGVGFSSTSVTGMDASGSMELWLENLTVSGYTVRMVGTVAAANSADGIYSTPAGSYPNGTGPQLLSINTAPTVDGTYMNSGAFGDLLLDLTVTGDGQTNVMTDCYISGPGADPF